jgi:putative spermidine/putrescine transport system permease protein
MLGQSVWLGLLTTLLTLLLGYPLAYHLAFTRSRFKPLLLFFLISPLLVGVVIRCYGWMILLADSGLINQWLKGSGVAPGGLPLMYNTFGIVLALVHVFLPYMVLSIVGVLRRIDPALVEAAQNLGASRPRILWEVIWPLTIPGVAAGCLLVFSLAISSYVVPILLGGFKVLLLPIVIYDQMLSLYDWPFGAANAMVLLAISLVILVAYFGLVDRLSRRLST